nr:hypothetical protein [uncultured Dysosmobacter sp.]
MTTEINIKNYLSEDEIKKICIEVVRNRFYQNVGGEADAERVIVNLSYAEVLRIIQNEWDTDLTEALKVRMREAIEDDSSLRFQIFRKKSEYEREDGPGWKIVLEEIEKCRPLIRNKIEEIIRDFDFDMDIMDVMRDALDTIIEEKLFTKRENKQ